jgi:molybdopterin synthase sulfur carrier subunit
VIPSYRSHARANTCYLWDPESGSARGAAPRVVTRDVTARQGAAPRGITRAVCRHLRLTTPVCHQGSAFSLDPYTRAIVAVTVRVPGPLRRLTSGEPEVKVEGATVADVLGALEAQYPGFRDRLYDDSGNLRQFINIYVNDSDIRFGQGLDTPISERDELSIVPAVAGGGR